MDNLRRDFRQAVRLFRQAPGFSAVIVLTLGLGVGANASLFSLFDQVLLRPLPVRDPDGLVLLSAPGPNSGWITSSSEKVFPISQPMYLDFRDRNRVFSGVLARFPSTFHVSGGEVAEEVDGSIVSGTYFDVLGVHPLVGRLLTPADDPDGGGGDPVAVLSHGYWTRRFGADVSVVGRRISVNGNPFTVVGVSQAGFRGVQIGRSADVFVPIAAKPLLTPTWNGIGERRVLWLEVMARLVPGVEMAEAKTAMDVLYGQILQAEAAEMVGKPAGFLERFVAKKLELMPGGHGAPDLQSRLGTSLLVLAGMVGLVVLIACANVANLLLARASARQREVAIRLSLGATRSALVRQLLVEGGLLALCGAAAGLLLASWTAGLLIGALPLDGARQTLSADADWRMTLFALSLGLVTAVLVSLAPILQGSRPRLTPALQESGGGGLSGGPLRLRRGLVVAQIALSALLLVGAGLFARSLGNLQRIDPGFDRDGLLSFSLSPRQSGRSEAASLRLFADLQRDLGALPGVRGVGMSSEALMTDSHDISTVGVEGYQAQEGEDLNPDISGVSPGLFATLGIPVVAGRDISETDTQESPPVAVVNEAFARYFFGDQSPIGRRFGWGRDAAPEIEIVGLVHDAKAANLRDEARRFVYIPYTQYQGLPGLTVYLRVEGSGVALAGEVREVVRAAAPGLPVADLTTMEQTIADNLFVDRMVAWLSAAFGLLATLLAAVGLFGLMSYLVTRRTRELGIRAALGANRRRILRLVLSEVAVLAGLGMAIGLPGGWGLGRLVESRLFGLAPFDPLTIALAGATLAVVVLVAGALPAARASRVDPTTALRGL